MDIMMKKDTKMKTCLNLECPLVSYCRWYNPTVNRGSGCRIQDEIFAAAKEAVTQREQNNPDAIWKHVLTCSEPVGNQVCKRTYYFTSINDAREFMRGSFTVQALVRMLPTGPESDERKADIGENFIHVKNCDEIYTWDISPEKVLIPSSEYMSSISPVYICRPRKALRKWGIDFNRGGDYAGAPVSEFVEAFFEHIYPGNEDKWYVDGTEKRRFNGNCFFKYIGCDPEKDLPAAAQKLASVLYTRVEEIPVKKDLRAISTALNTKLTALF